jgi:hypothetical protein
MTLSAFAAVELTKATPKAIVAALSKGTSKLRIDNPQKSGARKGLRRQPIATSAIPPSRIAVFEVDAQRGW